MDSEGKTGEAAAEAAAGGSGLVLFPTEEKREGWY